MGILDLQVKPRPQRVDRVLHFHHPERTFLKKSVEVDTSHPLFLHSTLGLPGPGGVGEAGREAWAEEVGQGEVYACSSDPEIMCEVRKTVSVVICCVCWCSVLFIYLFFAFVSHVLYIVYLTGYRASVFLSILCICAHITYSNVYKYRCRIWRLVSSWKLWCSHLLQYNASECFYTGRLYYEICSVVIIFFFFSFFCLVLYMAIVCI